MIPQVQRRRFKGMTIQGNYTWAHCIDDGLQRCDPRAQGIQTQAERRRAESCEL
jgi:hypothetical protein